MSETNNKLILGLGALGLGAAAGLMAARRYMRSYDFAGKTVLITGGSRGLGLVLARAFADEGAKVVICARDREELQRAKADIESRGGEVYDYGCDMRNKSEVETMVEFIRSRIGPVDVLINNAGVIQVGPLELQTQQDFEDAMAIHFWAPFYAMQAVLPEMRRKREGRIVNIASIGAKVPVPHLAPYCASKFALAGLSASMRNELTKDNIYVTTVNPGLMRTGSHINAYFKGQNEAEFALFSLSAALPLTSIKAERAAAQIVDAARRGDAELIISVQAKLAAKAFALAPELVSDVMSLINGLLPGPGGIGTDMATGLNSTSEVAPSLLTILNDKASYRNNELKPNEQIH